MTWLALRQFRVQGVVMAGLVGGLAVLFALAGRSGPEPTTLVNSLYYVGNVTIFVLPALLGAFWGAPLVARELEAGTHNLVWNKGITRGRWLATKVALVGGAAALLSGLSSLAVTWWASDASQEAGSRVLPVVFGARGVAPAGYALFAFCLGLVMGILLRRVLPAMAVTLAVFLAVQIAVPVLVREHLVPATQETVAISLENMTEVRFVNSGRPEDGVQEVGVRSPAGTWMTGHQLVDGAGNPAAVPQVLASCLIRWHTVGAQRDELPTCMAQTAEAGYRQRLSYHGESTFWPLQWTELGLFLALSGGLLWLAFRRIRKVH
jgi:hypothetical protein